MNKGKGKRTFMRNGHMVLPLVFLQTNQHSVGEVINIMPANFTFLLLFLLPILTLSARVNQRAEGNMPASLACGAGLFALLEAIGGVHILAFSMYLIAEVLLVFYVLMNFNNSNKKPNKCCVPKCYYLV